MKKETLGNKIYVTVGICTVVGSFILVASTIRSFGYSWLGIGLLLFATILFLLLHICFKVFLKMIEWW